MSLIEVDAFVKSINESIAEAHKWGANAQTDEIRIRAEQAIATFCEASLRARQMPEVDAVPVVRCRECVYWASGANEDESWEYCYWFESEIDGNEYCSYGERKGGDGDD